MLRLFSKEEVQEMFLLDSLRLQNFCCNSTLEKRREKITWKNIFLSYKVELQIVYYIFFAEAHTGHF